MLNKENIRKMIGIVSFAIVLYWSLQNLSLLSKGASFVIGLALPFLIGGFLAFLMNVPLRAVERALFPQRQKDAALLHKQSKKPKANTAFCRMVSLIVTLAIMLGIVLVVVFLIVPEIGNSYQMLKSSIPGFLVKIHQWTDAVAARVPEAAGLFSAWNLDWAQLAKLDWAQLGGQVFEFLRSGAGSFFNSTFSIAASIFSGIVTGCLAIIFAIYLLMNKEKLSRQTKQVLYACLPEQATDQMIAVAGLTDRTFSRFLSGQCIEAVILGMLFFISMSLLRFPYALMISVLIGFTALVPIFGAFLGCAVGAFLILIVNPMQAFWFLILFLVLQQIEGNFIYPKVVGTSVGLPSMWVLVAVTLGASTMGILGMLFYIPLFSVLYSLVRGAVHKKLKEREIPSSKLS